MNIHTSIAIIIIVSLCLDYFKILKIDYRVSMIGIAVLLLYNPSNNEDFATTSKPNDLEGVNNISSMYNDGHLIVSNLTVLNDTKLGDLNIRNDRIGVKGRGDIQFRDNGNMYYLDYDTTAYNNGSIRAQNLYADSKIDTHSTKGSISSNKIKSTDLESTNLKVPNIDITSKGTINVPYGGLIDFAQGGEIYGASNYIWHKPIDSGCCGAVPNENNSSVKAGVKKGSVAMGLHGTDDTIRFQVRKTNGIGIRGYVSDG